MYSSRLCCSYSNDSSLQSINAVLSIPSSVHTRMSFSLSILSYDRMLYLRMRFSLLFVVYQDIQLNSRSISSGVATYFVFSRRMCSISLVGMSNTPPVGGNVGGSVGIDGRPPTDSARSNCVKQKWLSFSAASTPSLHLMRHTISSFFAPSLIPSRHANINNDVTDARHSKKKQNVSVRVVWFNVSMFPGRMVSRY